SAYLVPQMFIILLLSLPLHLSKMAQILVAFSLGLVVDLFTSTPGIHASACLWFMLLRMNLLGRQDLKEHEANKALYNLRIASMGPYIYTTVILVFFYHFYIFWLESIGATHFIKLLYTAVASSILSLMIIGILEYISLSKARE
ncbi:MAG: hypothetical protein ACPGYY_10040, partial [Bacteroidia bacterium]